MKRLPLAEVAALCLYVACHDTGIRDIKEICAQATLLTPRSSAFFLFQLFHAAFFFADSLTYTFEQAQVKAKKVYKHFTKLKVSEVFKKYKKVDHYAKPVAILI
jgi:hypothetical protein